MNPFYILDVSIESSDEEIREKYIKKIKQFPPEKNPEKFIEIKNAYEMLKNEWSRYKSFLLYPPSNEIEITNIFDKLEIKKKAALPKLSQFIKTFEAIR